MLKPFKYVIQASAIEVDEHGNVTGEAIAEPRTLYGSGAVTVWITDFEAGLTQQNDDDVTAAD